MVHSLRSPALGDRHVSFPENHKPVEDLRPECPADRLPPGGDAAELFPGIAWASPARGHGDDR
jgi:hypothetical protein